MAVLKNADGTELLVDCSCGCNDGFRFKIDKLDCEWYCFMSYTNGAFYRDQEDTFFRVLHKKLRKIWAIIRNKDFYYGEVSMTKADFEVFRNYLNDISTEDAQPKKKEPFDKEKTHG